MKAEIKSTWTYEVDACERDILVDAIRTRISALQDSLLSEQLTIKEVNRNIKQEIEELVRFLEIM